MNSAIFFDIKCCMNLLLLVLSNQSKRVDINSRRLLLVIKTRREVGSEDTERLFAVIDIPGLVVFGMNYETLLLLVEVLLFDVRFEGDDFLGRSIARRGRAASSLRGRAAATLGC